MGRQTSTIRVSLPTNTMPPYILLHLPKCTSVQHTVFKMCHHTFAKEDMLCSSLSGHNPCLRNATEPEGEREGEKGNPAAERGQDTNSHLHHICQSCRPCPASTRKVGGDNLHLLTPASTPVSMRIVGTPGPARSICIWREGTDTPDTCPDCCFCSKSYDSFTNCQSLKSDNSSHRFCISRRSNTWPRMHSYRIQTS